MDIARTLSKTELSLLEQVWGTRLMAYLLACDETALRNYISDASQSPLSAEKQQALENLFLPKAQELHQLPTSIRNREIDRFLSSRTSENQALSVALRASMGGATGPSRSPSGVDNSTLESILIEMACDSYASLLAPVSNRLSTGPDISLFNHPRFGMLMREMEADPDISLLHPSDPIPGSFGRGGSIIKNTGAGGSIDQASFAETVISSSWRRASWNNKDPDLNDLIESLHKNLELIRHAIRRTPSDAPARVGLAGFKLPEGRGISTPWGTLRSILPWELELAPRQGGTIIAQPDGGEITVPYAGHAVLQLAQPYDLSISEWPALKEHTDSWFRGQSAKLTAQADYERIISDIATSVLLATFTQPSIYARTRWTWTWQFDPLVASDLLHWASPLADEPHILSSQECDDFEGLLAEIYAFRNSPHGNRLEIAFSRLLSAADHRRAEPDRLVDAVIVWENLFGTTMGEPTLRISLSLAWLLGDDYDSRDRLYGELKEIYAARSDIVHGTYRKKARSLSAMANRALEISCLSLRSLIESHPAILALADGADRSALLMLGGLDQATTNRGLAEPGRQRR